jgi:hypothetical protein
VAGVGAIINEERFSIEESAGRRWGEGSNFNNQYIQRKSKIQISMGSHETTPGIEENPQASRQGVGGMRQDAQGMGN